MRISDWSSDVCSSDLLIDGDWRTFELDPDLQLPRRANIDVLPAGRRPTEGIRRLTIQSVAALLDELRERYDMVVIDVPPLLGVDDGRMLAMLADDVIFAIRWGRTRSEEHTSELQSLMRISYAVFC